MKQLIFCSSFYLISSLLYLCDGILAIQFKINEVNSYFPFVHLSDDNKFVYKDITDYIVFGDSYSQVGTNFTDKTYTGKNRSHGKNWPLQFIDIHSMKMWNFAESGSTVNMNIL